MTGNLYGPFSERLAAASKRPVDCCLVVYGTESTYEQHTVASTTYLVHQAWDSAVLSKRSSDPKREGTLMGYCSVCVASCTCGILCVSLERQTIDKLHLLWPQTIHVQLSTTMQCRKIAGLERLVLNADPAWRVAANSNALNRSIDVDDLPSRATSSTLDSDPPSRRISAITQSMPVFNRSVLEQISRGGSGKASAGAGLSLIHI